MLAVTKTLTSNLTVFRRTVRLMGDDFEISVVGDNPVWANERIENAISEISRVEKLLSTFTDDSAINQINRNAGIKPVKVTAEIFNLVERSLQISSLTYGAYDITYYPADKSVNDADSDNNTTITTPYAVTCAGYKNVVLDAKATTVFLKEKEMRIGFGANSKGYAADRAKYILQMNGVSSGVINAGGDLLTWGFQPNFEPWTIAAADPSQEGQAFANIAIGNMAMATSVNADKYATINHKKSRSAKPKNGFIVSQIKSVSVLSPSAEFADAMASPVLAMGINAGLYLINQLNQLGCVIIDDHNRIYTSKDIHITD
ncbi:MAG: FAD:protein FMN transferase [Mucilaginibacter sp.]